MRIRRMLLGVFGNFYNELIGRRSRLGAAAVIFDPQDRLLMVQHSYGRRNWELPGGGRKANESVEQTLHREVREEAGVEVVIDRLCGIYYEPKADQHHFAFQCHLPEGSNPRASSPEILACAYWPLSALPRPVSDFTLRRIDDARSGRSAISINVLGPRRWVE
jgi:8-oxo-dGTP pyrophosphatase MutT (NUDIX family)